MAGPGRRRRRCAFLDNEGAVSRSPPVPLQSAGPSGIGEEARLRSFLRPPDAATGGTREKNWRTPWYRGVRAAAPGGCSRRSARGMLKESWRTLRLGGCGLLPYWMVMRTCRTTAVTGGPEVSARSASEAPCGTVPCGGAEADGVPAVIGDQDGVKGDRQAGEVAVVDPAVSELGSQLGQGLGPIASGERLWCRDLHAPFDDLYRRPAGGCGAGLLPGAMPTGGRTPLGDRSPGSRGDRPAAPAAGRRGGPPRGTTYGLLRVGSHLRCRRSLDLLAPLPLALSSPVLGGAAVTHARDDAGDPPVTQHNELKGSGV